ncbi:MAG: hypothetical protein GY842_23190 [bacterium]|nr:hypothetical protein [bacterium]
MNWSFGIGRLFRIDLRVHVLFVLGAVVVLARSLSAEGGGLSDATIQLALLFLIVLIHEFGHCFGCRSTGGEANEILMWPLGGLAYVVPPHKWRAHLVTTLAGPAVNVGFCLLTAAVLVLWTSSLASVPWNPLHPFRPLAFEGFSPSAWSAQSWLVTFFGLNYMILLFNLLPVYPLDGGRALQNLLWPRMGFSRSTKLASGIGMVGAVVFGLVGLLMEEYLLLGIAIFGYMTCWQQRQQLKMMGEMETGPFGYDFSQGYTSLDGSDESTRSPGYLERRRAKKEASQREAKRRELEQRSDRLDQLLTKVREDGLGSLTSKERRFLQEETARRQAADTRP